MHDLRSFKLYYVILLPSIYIVPEAGYIILNKQFIKVDFPAPVLPTMPTF